MLPVEVFDIAKQKNFTGRIIDLSASGAAIVGSEELISGAIVRLTFTFENNTYKDISAKIVREIKRQDTKHLGSAFFSLDDQTRLKLEESVRRVNSRILRGCR